MNEVVSEWLADQLSKTKRSDPRPYDYFSFASLLLAENFTPEIINIRYSAHIPVQLGSASRCE